MSGADLMSNWLRDTLEALSPEKQADTDAPTLYLERVESRVIALCWKGILRGLTPAEELELVLLDGPSKPLPNTDRIAGMQARAARLGFTVNVLKRPGRPPIYSLTRAMGFDQLEQLDEWLRGLEGGLR